MHIRDKIIELLEKINKLKLNGKVEIYLNTGGVTGIKYFKEEKID
jgi:hypothetical protein